MLIAGEKYGQLANRLFKFGHYIASSIENDIKLIFPYFDDYKDLFPELENEKAFSIHFHKNKRINKIYHIGFSVLNKFTKHLFKKSNWHETLLAKKIEINLSDPSVKSIIKKKLVILNGWNIRDRENFNKQASEIKRIFKPHGIHENNINHFISKLRKESDYLVGVHIRLGDYKDYHNGIYFYPLEFYASKCKELYDELSLSLNKKVVFVLCSDQNLDFSAFKDLNFVPSTGHIIEDLYILSNCNRIIGPPSTFSMWASFYGNVPLLHLHNKEQKINIDEFKVHSE